MGPAVAEVAPQPGLAERDLLREQGHPDLSFSCAQGLSTTAGLLSLSSLLNLGSLGGSTPGGSWLAASAPMGVPSTAAAAAAAALAPPSEPSSHPHHAADPKLEAPSLGGSGPAAGNEGEDDLGGEELPTLDSNPLDPGSDLAEGPPAKRARSGSAPLGPEPGG